MGGGCGHWTVTVPHHHITNAWSDGGCMLPVSLLLAPFCTSPDDFLFHNFTASWLLIVIQCSAQPAIILVYCGHFSGRKMLAEFTKVIVPRVNYKSMEILVIGWINGRICLTCETVSVITLLRVFVKSFWKSYYIVILYVKLSPDIK